MAATIREYASLFFAVFSRNSRRHRTDGLAARRSDSLMLKRPRIKHEKTLQARPAEQVQRSRDAADKLLPGADRELLLLTPPRVRDRFTVQLSQG
jgi:hypothetical protein